MTVLKCVLLAVVLVLCAMTAGCGDSSASSAAPSNQASSSGIESDAAVQSALKEYAQSLGRYANAKAKGETTLGFEVQLGDIEAKVRSLYQERGGTTDQADAALRKRRQEVLGAIQDIAGSSP